jgi:hypothetical protein
MASTALESQEAAALAAREEALAALAAQQEEEFDDTFQVPILKLGQALTKEVQNDDHPAQQGDWINTLTGETYGRQIDFIVCYYQQGRAAADRDTNKYYVAFGDTIPEAWAPLVGESFVGTRFDEYPDAEEKYKERVNNDEIPWGKGPKVSTTHNFTGLVLAPVRDEDDQLIEDEFELAPVRVAFSRSQVPAARKINQLKRMNLRSPKMFWDRLFTISTEKKEFNSGPSYIPVPTLGRPTKADEKEAAQELALAVAAGRVTDNAEVAEDVPTKPESRGGLGV